MLIYIYIYIYLYYILNCLFIYYIILYFKIFIFIFILNCFIISPYLLTVFSPPFTASTLYNLRLLEGQRFSKAFEALKRDFPDIFLTGIKFWPFILLLNFYFIPLNFRVIFVQIAALLWNAYFSYRTQLCAGLYPDVY
ncbi:unnamed protein product [Dracunculus medinensis]|uniref:Mitochondrial inner membrane protein Mpv17 n=1 Tax=Dracunculus medinensis TaxID=318479 RepID=A0A3P7S7X9_DRAME|nr:unnamed protein product [Dracunculus medinensis]